MRKLINKTSLKFTAGFLGIIFFAIAGVLLAQHLEAAQSSSHVDFGSGQAGLTTHTNQLY